ncbi:hypothetical protein NXT08_22400 [Rhodococcus pyridinivorans]|uniref:hypothetical protein n=1 Tax=Rhodococcus pyridinivorans TaxID=103816 RepID=UPI000BA236CF|nr:hypothetical protein [Rhodococcus pyridinivorans]UVT24955.1 hypothetical protein NXT08_22400 [Rhodococcus pyridinivorans]
MSAEWDGLDGDAVDALRDLYAMTPGQRETVLELLYQVSLTLASILQLTESPEEFAQAMRNAFAKSIDPDAAKDRFLTAADIDDEGPDR